MEAIFGIISVAAIVGWIAVAVCKFMDWLEALNERRAQAAYERKCNYQTFWTVENLKCRVEQLEMNQPKPKSK